MGTAGGSAAVVRGRAVLTEVRRGRRVGAAVRGVQTLHTAGAGHTDTRSLL